MKNIILRSLLCLIVVLSATSCVTYKDFTDKFNTAPVYNLADAQVVNGAFETELEMIGEVTATHTFTDRSSSKLADGIYIVDDDFLLRFKSDKALLVYAQAKASVLYKAIEKAQCDMILAPIYKLEVKGEKSVPSGYVSAASSTYTISVKGFGANITGVKQK